MVDPDTRIVKRIVVSNAQHAPTGHPVIVYDFVLSEMDGEADVKLHGASVVEDAETFAYDLLWQVRRARERFPDATVPPADTEGT